MRGSRVGHRLYLSVMAVFLVFAASFITFQWSREKQYKEDILEERLQGFNVRLHDALLLSDGSDMSWISAYVARQGMHSLRVTIIDRRGQVLFDNVTRDNRAMGNHANRPEVVAARQTGRGSEVDRNSRTLGHEYFYSATCFAADSLVVRSALPYDNDLLDILRIDQHFVWFALVAIAVLTLVLYRFLGRLGTNVTNLKTFASRAEHSESIEVEDLAAFPADELGEIAEKIVKLYRRLQTTRGEQEVLKRQLTQNIAHELKTPVASIQGYLETLISNPDIPEATRRQFLDRCFAQSGRLTSLLRDISLLNRMDDAPDMGARESVDVTAMVAEIQSATALLMEQRHMQMVCSLPHITVWGNRSLLYSVFRNLTDNAIAYAGEGTTVTISAEHQMQGWRFVFRDNGVGVPAEHLPRLFERFYRVDKGRSRKMGGTGLGLAVVKNAVLAHHGSIQVATAEGGGLAFTFFLPQGDSGQEEGLSDR